MNGFIQEFLNSHLKTRSNVMQKIITDYYKQMVHQICYLLLTEINKRIQLDVTNNKFS